MQVFKTFFAVVRKNIGLMCMYTGIFVGIAITIANVVPAEGGASFQETKTSVTVIDRDNSALSAAITNYLYGRQTAVPLEDDQSVLQDALYRRVTSYILFIPAGYEQAFLGQASPEMETAQVPDSYSGAYVDNQVESYVKTVRAYTQAGFGLEAALEAAQADNARAVPVALTQTVVQSRAGVYYFFQFLCYGMAMVMIFGLAPVLLAFSQKGLAARMNASALPLRKRNHVDAGFAQAVERMGGLDVLVNNGHEAVAADWTEVSAEQFTRQLANATGYFLLARRMREHAVARGAGASVIMLGSMYGLVGSYPDAYRDVCPASPVAYHALKGGVVHLTRHLAVYWAGDRVRVNCLSPGPFPSPKAPAEMVRRLTEHSPMKRMGLPHELKGAVVFLASDASSYMTGQNLVIDGGWTAW